MVYDNPNHAPKAYSTKYYKCDACERLHVVLVDKDDKYIATAVISRDVLEHMFKVIDDDPTILTQ
jgi:hypothetical protein